MSDKVSVSFKLTEMTQQQVLEQVIKEGYGMRGKSRWISEAISTFLQLPNFPEFVDIATDESVLNVAVSARLERQLAQLMDEALIKVRQQYPQMEGVKSNLIRASIYQRLIRG